MHLFVVLIFLHIPSNIYNMTKYFFIRFFIVAVLGISTIAQAQTGALLSNKHKFTRRDTLRGTLNDNRSWYDVGYYDLALTLNTDKHYLKGYNDIYFTVNTLPATGIMQIDLFEVFAIDSVVMNGKKLATHRDGDAFLVHMPDNMPKGSRQKLRVYYQGTPPTAKNAPWDGGFVWQKDKMGRPWVSVACQGFGASSWWPCKDHQSDEPDSMRISCAVPSDLFCAANGNLQSVTPEKNDNDAYLRYEWKVSYPINTYGVSITAGYLTNFSEYYTSPYTGDSLHLSYYVLDYNLEKAQKHFEQVKPMLACYEEFLGAYPFPHDGFALIETPFLGMEHQSGIAYGNNYMPGYAGMRGYTDGLDFDYIIIHETGHEWWGNSITTADIADMWIHEGFCTYAESQYVECLMGYDRAQTYINSRKGMVGNKSPITGIYGMNTEGDGDMYSKGMLLLNTLRHLVGNDSLWWATVKGIQRDFKYQVVTSKQIEQYINQKTGKNFDKVFAQYLYYPAIPELQYQLNKKGKLRLRWKTDVTGFDMPVFYKNKAGKWTSLQPTNDWQIFNVDLPKKANHIEFAENQLYIHTTPENP